MPALTPSCAGQSPRASDPEPINNDSPDQPVQSPDGPEEFNGSPKAESPAQSNGSASMPARKKGHRNLTSAQLAKKRANDREAQRAIRKRTKTQIELLEQRVQELESGDGYQELRKVTRQKDALQAQVDDMRKQLSNVMNLLQPMVAHGDWKETNTPDSSTIDSNDSEQSTKYEFAGSTPGHHGPQQDQIEQAIPRQDHGGVLSIGSLTTTYTPPSSSRLNVPHRTTPAVDLPSPPEAVYSRAKSTWSTTHDSHPRSQNMPSNTIPTPNPPTTSCAIHAQLPSHIPPTCPFDTILSDFAIHARRLINGRSLKELFGPPQLDYSSLMHPETRTSDDSLILTNLLIDILKGFSALNGWPEKVAIMYHMFFFIRWMIEPSPENYELLPLALKPLDIQLKVAHPIWVDYIPWRRMRYKMVYDYVCVSLDDFFLPYTTTLSVNWWSTELCSCIYHDSVTGKTLLRPDFEAHLGDENNWTLGKYFEDALPLLANTCYIKERSQ